MTLICEVCGQIEYSPFEDGDKCICDGRFHGIEWYRSRLTLALSRIEAAEAFIGARLACCTKNHLCDADELQRDFETFTRWQSTIRAMEGRRDELLYQAGCYLRCKCVGCEKILVDTIENILSPETIEEAIVRLKKEPPHTIIREADKE